MIFGIGTDIIEVERVRKTIEKTKSFKQKVFNIKEIEYCDSLASPYQSYAVRFAAKEAFMKALGTGWRDGLAFNEIFVVNNDLGKPMLCLEGEAVSIIEKNGISNIHLSMSHIKDYATATIILEK